MKKTFFILVVTLILFPLHAESQWRILRDFPLPDSIYNQHESITITSIYFLDLPGPPRIGFIGIYSSSSYDTIGGEGGEVWKTTDGGLSWKQKGPVNDRAFFGSIVQDITFADSLTGWLTSDVNTKIGCCYKTTDGGETWARLPASGYFSWYISYHPATNRLFMEDEVGNSGGLTSTDEGTTWQYMGFQFSSCAFVDDSVGIASGFEGFGPGPNFTPCWRTTTGGKTWSPLNVNYFCTHILAIPGTKTFLILDDTSQVLRTDDAGLSWRKVYQFTPIKRPYYSFFNQGQSKDCTEILGTYILRHRMEAFLFRPMWEIHGRVCVVQSIV